MKMNKLMEPYWQGIGDWRSLKLPKQAEEILDIQIADVNEEEDCHVCLLDLGIENDFLNHALKVVARLFEKYAQTKRFAPLVALVSLDDGSELEDFEATRENPWFDCSIHFHVEHPDGTVFMNPTTLERCTQPVLVIDSNDPIFSKDLARD